MPATPVEPSPRPNCRLRLGSFRAGLLSYDIRTHHLAPGVDYVKQDTETRMGERMLVHIILQLEKYEPAPHAG
jgi:hypothetical protein